MSSQSQIQRSALNRFTNTMKTGYPLPKKSHRTCINYYVFHTLNISSTITQLVKLQCPLFTLPSNNMFPSLMVSGFKSHSLTLAPDCWWNSREISSNPAASRDDRAAIAWSRKQSGYFKRCLIAPFYIVYFVPNIRISYLIEGLKPCFKGHKKQQMMCLKYFWYAPI